MRESKLRAAGYIRVSDESQVEGHSLAAQRREITRYCQNHGYELVKVYADEGVSAYTDRIGKRPELSRLLEDARHRSFGVVVVHTLDRWARNNGVQRQALQRLGECDVGFASVTEDLDYTTPIGKMMLTTLGAMSEFFSDQLGVHVNKAQRQRTELGLPVGDVPDEQMGRIVGAILLPDAWMDRVLARIHLASEMKRIEQERRLVERRLKRLGRAYVDGLYGEEDYKRKKRNLEAQLASLAIPDVDAAKEAGKLLEELPTLWEEAELAERRKLLSVMLEAVYVDTVEERAIVALKPKAAFRALFQIATTREGSGVVLYNENPPEAFSSPEDDSPCFWWRRGRVELPVQKAP